MEFFGLLFSQDGVRPDAKKIPAFNTITTLTTVSEVRSLLGMANYMQRSSLMLLPSPNQKLTHKGTKFSWNKEHEEAYQKIKTALLNSPVMSYFDIRNETQLIVDASPVGLAAILTQRPPGKNTPPNVIAYASRALTPTEQRYSQTDKEALAIVWGIEHFHILYTCMVYLLYRS